MIEGSIDGGTIDGPINLTGSGQSLSLVGGPVVDGASGTGPGTINVTGYDSTLISTTRRPSTTRRSISAITRATIASICRKRHDRRRRSGPDAGLGRHHQRQGYAQITAGSYSGDGIVSEGVINVTTTGASLMIAAATFTNTGTINDTGGALSIDSAAFTNEGAIDVANGQTLTVPNGTTFTNATGTITLDGTSSLVVDEALTTAQFGTVDAASGATLDFAAVSTMPARRSQVGAGVVVEGSIDGGTIDGAINLTAYGQSLSLIGGPIVDSAGGTGPGTINVTGESAYLYFDNTQTFDGATINLGNTMATMALYLSKTTERSRRSGPDAGLGRHDRHSGLRARFTAGAIPATGSSARASSTSRRPALL